MEKGLFASVGLRVKANADSTGPPPLPRWLWVSVWCHWAMWCPWQRPEAPLPVSSPLCSSSSHPIPVSVLCGLTELTCIWGGPLSPGQSGTEERGLKHYWFTSWPDQKTPDRAPPLLHLVREVEEAAQQEGPHCAPIIVHCRWVLPATRQGRAAHPPLLPRPSPHPSPRPSAQGLGGLAASLPPASAASSCGRRVWWTS